MTLQGSISRDESAIPPRWLILLSFLVIGAVALITFHPIEGIGFFAEDYMYVDQAARWTFQQYMSSYFQQCISAAFCRPAQGFGVWIEQMVFGNNVVAYRLVQILIHLANCILLFVLVERSTKKWRIGFLAGLIYCALPAIVQAFFWFNISDQAASFYYLIALLFWLKYLKQKEKVDYAVAVGAFLLSSANKEFGITVPLALLLMDRWVVREHLGIVQIIRRYLAFALVGFVYIGPLILRLAAFTKSDYRGLYEGMGFGPQSLANLGYYIAALASPWQGNQPGGPITLLLVALPLLCFSVYKRDTRIVFLCTMAILPLIPVLIFSFVGMRYLYQSMMVPAVLFAILFEVTVKVLSRWRVFSIASAVAIALIVFGSATYDAESFFNMQAFSRQYRTPMRQVFQQHSQFEEGTYLYFLNSPIQTPIISGMVSLRYDTGVTVGGTDSEMPAELARHNKSFVYFFDDQNRVVEQPVEQTSQIKVKPEPPISFSIPVRLEGYELTSTKVKRGQTLVALLYWKGLARMDKDYTVFAHLVNANGQFVTGSDNQPRNGNAPTSSWDPGRLVVDWVVIPITNDVPVGDDYRLEIGWYYLPTMERATVVGAQGQLTDKVLISPFEIQ